MPAIMREAQALDWLDDLREFGAEIVSVACMEWRRSQTKRPTPAEIRRLCIEEQNRQRERVAITGPEDTDVYARSVGFESNAERLAAIRANQSKRAARDAELQREGRELRYSGADGEKGQRVNATLS